MRTFNLAPLAILALGVTSAYAQNCYKSGTVGDQTYVVNNIALICDDTTPNMGGNYAPLQTKHQCWDTPDGNHWDFWITNNMATTQFMDPNGCITFLGGQVDKCSKGADQTLNFQTSDWRFM